jgi:hypothetical protein
MAKIKYRDILPGRYTQRARIETNTTHLIFVEGISDAKFIETLVKPIDAPQATIELLVCDGDIITKNKKVFVNYLRNPDAQLQKVALLADMDKHTVSQRKDATVTFLRDLFGNWRASEIINAPYHFGEVPPTNADASLDVSYFLMPAVYADDAKTVQNRQGTFEHYFVEYQTQALAHLEPCQQFHNSVFSPPWWGAETPPLDLENAQAKWLSAVMLLANPPDDLANCRSELGLACQQGHLTPDAWPNLQALRDYLESFLTS